MRAVPQTALQGRSPDSGTQSWPPQSGEPTPRPTPPRRPAVATLVESPPVERLAVDGYIVSDFLDPTRAGDWVRCPHGPSCPDRGYLTVVYETFEDAIRVLPERADKLARRTLSHRDDALERLLNLGSLRFYIHRFAARGIVGRDYRTAGCGLPNAREQLRDGRGSEPAWCEIRRQRDEEEVEGALLPSATGQCELFMFVAAEGRIYKHRLVATAHWPVGGLDMAM